VLTLSLIYVICLFFVVQRRRKCDRGRNRNSESYHDSLRCDLNEPGPIHWVRAGPGRALGRPAGLPVPHEAPPLCYDSSPTRDPVPVQAPFVPCVGSRQRPWPAPCQPTSPSAKIIQLRIPLTSYSLPGHSHNNCWPILPSLAVLVATSWDLRADRLCLSHS